MPKRSFKLVSKFHIVDGEGTDIYVPLDELEPFLGSFSDREQALIKAAQEGGIVQRGDKWCLHEEGIHALAKKPKAGMTRQKEFLEESIQGFKTGKGKTEEEEGSAGDTGKE